MKNILRKTDHSEKVGRDKKPGKVMQMSDFVINNRIKGVPVSDGFVTGTAQVITDQTHHQNIEKGSILICKNASPDLTLYYHIIKGLVTDRGGSLNPATSTAREYHIPAVFGTGNATKTIRTGDTIRIKGASGTVEIL